MILADPHNPMAIELARSLTALVADVPPNLMVVVGGDGFLLHTVAAHGFDRVYLGLNAGRVGFLLNDIADRAQTARQISRRAYTVTAFPLLHGTVHTSQGTVSPIHAINDIYLERASGQTARLGIAIDGTTVVQTLVADGLIVATALGSSAYSFSAGGPACHPTLNLLCMTAICPHQPKLSPIVLPASSAIHVHVQDSAKRPVRAVADGREMLDVQQVTIATGKQTVRLAHLQGHDYTKRLLHKIVVP